MQSLLRATQTTNSAPPSLPATPCLPDQSVLTEGRRVGKKEGRKEGKKTGKEGKKEQGGAAYYIVSTCSFKGLRCFCVCMFPHFKVCVCLFTHSCVFLCVCSQCLTTSQAWVPPSQLANQSANIAYNWPQLASIECLLCYGLNDSSRPFRAAREKNPQHSPPHVKNHRPRFGCFNADALLLDLQQVYAVGLANF